MLSKIWHFPYYVLCCIVFNCYLYVIVLNRLVKLLCLYCSYNRILLNATNIFKVPEMAKKVVAPKKVPTVKKPETPAAKGIHVILDIIIFLKSILILKWNPIGCPHYCITRNKKCPYFVSINFNASPLIVGCLFLSLLNVFKYSF